MNFPGGWELVLVLVVILVVFGAKRLPDSARALGKSLRILKAEAKAMNDDDAKTAQPGNEPPKELPAAPARFDAVTGEPIARFDPYTGQPLAPPAGTER